MKTIPENLAEALARRNNCRIGLQGLEVTIGDDPAIRKIAESSWDRQTRLEIVLDSGRRVMADECVLISKWPVVCCHPSPRRKTCNLAASIA